MKEEKMVIFDWNGTLINDLSVWRKSINKIFALYDINPPSNEEFFKKFEEFRDFEEVYRFFGVNLSRKELDKIYHGEYQKHFDEIELSLGVKEALDILKNQRIVLGIITAQVKFLFEPLFFRFGLEKYFNEVITDAQKKNILIVHLCILREIELRNCYYVGDTPLDIHQAQKAGVKSIAYLNGFAPKELILKTKPDFTISHFKELPKLIGE